MAMPVILSAVFLVGCGSYSTNGCPNFCRDVRDKLLEQMPDVQPDEVRCHESPWIDAGTCEECNQILNDLFDVQATSEDCNGHF